MQISDEKITKFQMIYKKHFGIDLTPKQAREKGEILVRSMKLIYKPMTRTEFERVKARQKELGIT